MIFWVNKIRASIIILKLKRLNGKKIVTFASVLIKN